MKLPEMQQFALDLVNSKEKGLRPGELSAKWREHKGRYYRCDSRSNFGATSAAYKALRTLAEKGLIVKKDIGRDWTDLVFYRLNFAQ